MSGEKLAAVLADTVLLTTFAAWVPSPEVTPTELRCIATAILAEESSTLPAVEMRIRCPNGYRDPGRQPHPAPYGAPLGGLT